ncbi:hypothetical protein C8R47DRAFT_1104767 [Mycena vitilis]|nr:hypothetical protein C8R47DRAFT_1104767 [Mycena vitilis]
MFQTPPREAERRVSKVGQWIALTTQLPVIQSLPQSVYDPYDEDDAEDTRCTLVHATRSSNIENFEANGITAGLRRNTLVFGGAFYTAPDVRVAYMHALLHHPKVFDLDPICLLVFNVAPSILHGEVPFQGNQLTCDWFHPEDQAAEDNLIRHGMRCMFQKPAPTTEEFTQGLPGQADIVIAPLLIPGPGQTLHVSGGQFGGPQPVQIAAATLAARRYFNSCVTQIVTEARK